MHFSRRIHVFRAFRKARARFCKERRRRPRALTHPRFNHAGVAAAFGSHIATLSARAMKRRLKTKVQDELAQEAAGRRLETGPRPMRASPTSHGATSGVSKSGL
jgi:hypothetical protein